jgi:hypothetical protein
MKILTKWIEPVLLMGSFLLAMGGREEVFLGTFFLSFLWLNTVLLGAILWRQWIKKGGIAKGILATLVWMAVLYGADILLFNCLI